MNAPLVSTIIPAYNAERYIRDTVDSALQQSFSDLEIIVVDDGSTDNTSDIVAGLSDARIRYLKQPNAEQAAARNHGLSVARGTYVAFLDADDLWKPRKLQNQLDVFENETVDIVVTACDVVDERGAPVACDGRRLHRGNVHADMIRDNFFVMSSVMVRRRLLEQTGLVFQTGIQGVEDWDLWLKLTETAQVDYVAAPLVSYRRHGGNTSGRWDAMFRAQTKTLDNLDRRIDASTRYTSAQKRALLGISRRSRSYLSLQYGHWLVLEQRHDDARHMMKHAADLNPFALRNWWGMLKAAIRRR